MSVHGHVRCTRTSLGMIWRRQMEGKLNCVDGERRSATQVISDPYLNSSGDQGACFDAVPVATRNISYISIMALHLLAFNPGRRAQQVAIRDNVALRTRPLHAATEDPAPCQQCVLHPSRPNSPRQPLHHDEGVEERGYGAGFLFQLEYRQAADYQGIQCDDEVHPGWCRLGRSVGHPRSAFPITILHSRPRRSRESHYQTHSYVGHRDCPRIHRRTHAHVVSPCTGTPLHLGDVRPRGSQAGYKRAVFRRPPSELHGLRVHYLREYSLPRQQGVLLRRSGAVEHLRRTDGRVHTLGVPDVA